MLDFNLVIFPLHSAGSIRSPRPRRQRTTSINQTKTIDASESIIRANNRTIYTAGRPPWYNCEGKQVEPFVIGLFTFQYLRENRMVRDRREVVVRKAMT